MDLRQKHSYQNQFTHTQIKPVCAKAPYPVFPLGSVEYSHKTPWSFPKGRAAPQGLWRCGLGDIVVSNNKNLCASQAWGFGAPPRVPLRGSCWHSHCNPGELRGPHSGLNAVYRLSRWWFWSPLSFHPGSNPSWYLLPFCPKCSINCNISFRLKFPVGLFHSGHDSGKKKKKKFILCFPLWLGSWWSNLCQAGALGTISECLMAPLVSSRYHSPVWSRLIRIFWDHKASPRLGR